jgi:uncharacterized protein YjbI with pentapeptide repeats
LLFLLAADLLDTDLLDADMLDADLLDADFEVANAKPISLVVLGGMVLYDS